MRKTIGNPFNFIDLKVLMLSFLNKHKSVLSFSFLKFIEIAFTSFTTLYIGSILEPEEMSKVVPCLLYISYSSFLALGINQVLVKNYGENRIRLNSIMKSNFFFTLFVSIVSLLVSLFIFDVSIGLFIGLISFIELWRSYFMAIFRVKDRILILNKNNLIFAITFLTGTLIYVKSIENYLFIWAISLILSVLFYTYDGRNYLKEIFQLDVKLMRVFKINLLEGIQLSLLGISTTILLTMDRFVFNFLIDNKEVLGTYQMADFFGKGFYLVLTTVIFYFYPLIIRRLKDSIEFLKRYKKGLKRAFILLPLFLLVSYIFIEVLTIYIYKEYKNLPLFVTLNILIKFSVLMLSLVSTIYVAKNNEKIYLKIIFPVILLIFTILMLYGYFIGLKFIITLPIFLSLSSLVVGLKLLTNTKINDN